MSEAVLEANSAVWWEDYFQFKWEDNHGREQTRHFMERLVAALPPAVTEYLSGHPVSILDWGCAFGDGVDALASAFPLAVVAGYDFSARAIAQGRSAYPRFRFVLAGRDYLEPRYDAVL